MAQYNILNPVLKTIPEGKQNAGKKYLYASLQNAKCIWETPQTFTNFNENVVKAFEKLLPINKGGLAQQELPLPPELTTVTGCWIDYIPPQKFYKQHLSDHATVAPSALNPQGRPAIKAGELVKKNNIPIVYDTLRVFCLYYLDEFGEKQFLRGESPQEVGQRAFNAYCVPVPSDSTPQEVEPIPVVHAQPTPQPQTAQPQQAQFVQQPGQGQQPQPATPQQQPQFVNQPNVAQF